MELTRPDGACLEVEEVLAVIDGTVSAEARGRIDAHLDRCPACRALVSELARESRATLPQGAPTEPDAGPPLPLGRGDRLGRYLIERPLGAGAMGQVFLARDPALERKVAIKLLHSGREHAPFLEREAQALARLRHPNVVAIHDVGGEGDRRFVALEYVPGETLTTWLAGRRSLRQVLDVFRQAGEGLSAAHQAGLLHRDFKPDNVLVGEDGVAKVSDFGLARAPRTREGGGLLEADVSQAGSLVGTPSYMSPEVFAGDPVDARSDQFSFCVALWEALCGEGPFPGEGMLGMRSAVLAGKLRPPPPGHRMPAWLEPLLRRGLSREPERRFPSIAALLRAIERAQALEGALSPKRMLARALGIALTAAMAAGLIARTHVGQDFEARARGLLLAQTQRPWNDEVRLVQLDERTLQQFDWHVPRSPLARLIEALGAAGAKAIVIDGFFQSEALEGPQADQRFAEVARHGPKVVVAMPCTAELDVPLEPVLRFLDAPGRSLPAGPTPARSCQRVVLPLEPERDAVAVAQVEAARSEAGTVEGGFALLDVAGRRVPALALFAYALGNQLPIRQGPGGLSVGDREVPVDAHGVWRASFRLPYQDQIASLGALVAALPKDGPARLPEALARDYRGRFVLIGSTAESAHDLGAFADGRREPMVLLHGMLLADLIENRPVRVAAGFATFLASFLLALLAALSAARLRSRWIPFGLVLPLIGLFGTTLSFAREGLLIAPVTCALGLGLAFVGALAVRLGEHEGTRRQRSSLLLGQLPETEAAPVLAERVHQEGARRRASVLVASHPSVGHGIDSPEAELAAGRRLLDEAARCTWERGGRIEARRLDHLVAVFGEPQPLPDHALAAYAVGEALCERGWAVGLASGEVLVGDLGHPEAAHYGVLGPAVTEAGRLCAQAAAQELLLNPAARAACEGEATFVARGNAFKRVRRAS